MKEVIGIAEAAKILNVPKQHLRQQILNGEYPFGKAFKSEKGLRNSYKIYTKQMYYWLEHLDTTS